MKIFQVLQASTKAVLWVGGAQTADRALEVMAREAGYRNFAAVPKDSLGDVRVVQLSL